jgi:hypothetical protein
MNGPEIDGMAVYAGIFANFNELPPHLGRHVGTRMAGGNPPRDSVPATGRC